MPPSRLRLSGLLGPSTLGIIAGLAVAWWNPGDSSPRDAGKGLLGAADLPADPIRLLAPLELSPGQELQIEQLQGRERDWIEKLQCALAESERDLRSAEMAQPFDAERVNELISGQAEVIAYLRGTESRLVAEIARLLTPEQERRLAEMRASAPEPSPSSVIASLHPASASCPTHPAVLLAPPGREKDQRDGNRPEPVRRTAPRPQLKVAT